MAAGAAAWLVYAFAGSLGYQAGPAAYSASYNTAERLIRDSGFYDERCGRSRAPRCRAAPP